MHASCEGDSRIAKLLLQNGADVNAKDKDGITPLMIASYYEYTDIVQLLIKHEADVNAKNKYGQTVLMYVPKNDYNSVAKLLKQYGAKE